MIDYIIKATAADGMIRGFFATTKSTVNRAVQIHKTTPVVSAAMGRMLTAAAIMGSMLKSEKDLITLAIKGDGPMKGVVVTSDSSSRVKGYVYESYVDHPLNEKGKLDVSGAIGKGVLNVIKDIGMKEPYTGQVPLISGEIAEDLVHYFVKSEQTPSAVALGVLVDRDLSIKQAGGFLLQMMPGAPEELAIVLEEKISKLPDLTSLYEQNKGPEDIMEMLLGEFGYKVNDTVATEFFCNCNRERVEKALISVGYDELNKIIEEDGKATLHCHFCTEDYLFDENDLKRIVAEGPA